MSLYLKKELDPEILDLIADFICGDDVERFPEYRSSYYITKFFNNINIKKEHDGSTRKKWVLSTLRELNLDNLEKIILRLVDLREYRADMDKFKKALVAMNNILMMDGLKIKFEKNNPIIVDIECIDVEKILETKEEIINKSTTSGVSTNKKCVELERDKYLKEFLKENFHTYKCPACNSGYLEIDKETFKEESTSGSEHVYDETGEICFLKLAFHSFLRCNNKKCQEKIVLCGEGRVEEEYEDNEMGLSQRILEQYFTINYFNPSENIINISTSVPEKTRLLFKESFVLFWIDPSSAGNKVRKALESLMDEIGMKTDKLHNRIVELGKIEENRYGDLSEMLIGVKWLGNFGSHQEGLNREDLLDAYEVIDFVLHELFTKDSHLKNIQSKAKKLKEKYGNKK